MPTVYETKNLRIVIHTDDHDPPHVHVIGPDAEAKITIADLNCYFNKGFSSRDIKRIISYLKQRQAQLQEKWDEIYG